MLSMMRDQRDVEQLLGDATGEEGKDAAPAPPAPGRGKVVAGVVIAVVGVCAVAAAGYKKEWLKEGPAAISAAAARSAQSTLAPINIKGERQLESEFGVVNVAVPNHNLSEHAASCLKIALEFAESVEEQEKADGDVLDPGLTEEETRLHEEHSFAAAEKQIDAETSHRDHEAVVEALELYEKSVTPEQALEAGCVITDSVVNEIMGLPDTPESAAGSSASNMTVQGDMVGRDDQQVRELRQLADAGKVWGGILWESQRDIKFCFDPSINQKARSGVAEAIQHYKNLVPCIDFREVGVGSTHQKCAEEPAIYVQSSSNGCWANVGQPPFWGGKYFSSVMNIGQYCENMGIAAHELGHNLGMLHEQSRTDSTQYVQIMWDNIQPSFKDQYQFDEKADRSIQYDMLSLMHYGDTDFGTIVNGEKSQTMKAKKVQVSVMGNRMGLTAQDVKQVASMYGCLDEVEHFKLCTPDPLQCTTEDCDCHEDESSTVHKIKTTDSDGCHRCQKECPAPNYGSPGDCGCPAGKTKTSFVSGGTEYYSCKVDAPAPAPNPAPAPGPAPGQCSEDKQWWCHESYGYVGAWNCLPGYMINSHPILEACPTACGCPDENQCHDEYSTCGQYSSFCDSPGATWGEHPFWVVCQKTCGKCSCEDQYSNCWEYLHFCGNPDAKIDGKVFDSACQLTCQTCG